MPTEPTVTMGAMNSSASEEDWTAAMAQDEPDTPEEEAPDLSEVPEETPDAQPEPDAPPPGFSPEEWAALPAAAQQKLAQTIEAVDQRHREQYDRLAARHEDVQASYTMTMRSFKELAEGFKRPEPEASSPEAPQMPDPEGVDWTDGRAVAKYTQAVAKAVAAETETKIRAEMAGEVNRTKAETQREFMLRAVQEEQERASRAISDFQASHPDMEKYRQTMSAIIVQGEMEEQRAAALGKPVPRRTESQKLEAAYQEAKEQEEYRHYKAQKNKAKTSPSPTSLGAARNATQPQAKERKTIEASWDEAVRRFEKATGKKVEL